MFDTFPPDEWLGRIKRIRWRAHAQGTLRGPVLALLNLPGVVTNDIPAHRAPLRAVLTALGAEWVTP
jgi:hypothetical protein